MYDSFTVDSAEWAIEAVENLAAENFRLAVIPPERVPLRNPKYGLEKYRYKPFSRLLRRESYPQN